eukprot:XP_015584340.1 circumsporozoite protein [Ricinus communis]
MSTAQSTKDHHAQRTRNRKLLPGAVHSSALPSQHADGPEPHAQLQVGDCLRGQAGGAVPGNQRDLSGHGGDGAAGRLQHHRLQPAERAGLLVAGQVCGGAQRRDQRLTFRYQKHPVGGAGARQHDRLADGLHDAAAGRARARPGGRRAAGQLPVPRRRPDSIAAGVAEGRGAVRSRAATAAHGGLRLSGGAVCPAKPAIDRRFLQLVARRLPAGERSTKVTL